MEGVGGVTHVAAPGPRAFPAHVPVPGPPGGTPCGFPAAKAVSANVLIAAIDSAAIRATTMSVVCIDIRTITVTSHIILSYRNILTKLSHNPL